jgi:hypothetical protein
MPEINYDYEEILRNWDVKKEQQKADFLEHIYQCYKPGNHCYTGLWQRFCLEEAGPYCRDEYFARLEAIKKFQETELLQKNELEDIKNINKTIL